MNAAEGWAITVCVCSHLQGAEKHTALGHCPFCLSDFAKNHRDKSTSCWRNGLWTDSTQLLAEMAAVMLCLEQFQHDKLIREAWQRQHRGSHSTVITGIFACEI